MKGFYELGNTVLEHKHLIIRAELNEPPYLPSTLTNWLKELVNKIDMNILLGPYSIYSDMPGNQGLTAVVVIETSHLAVHVWDEVSPALAQIDVYSCKDFNIDDVFNALQDFQPSKIEYKFIDREHDLTNIKTGILKGALANG